MESLFCGKENFPRFRSHQGIQNSFRQNFIQTGIFDPELSDILNELSKSRAESDYGEICEFTEEEIEDKIQKAIYFLNEIEKYLNGELLP